MYLRVGRQWGKRLSRAVRYRERNLQRFARSQELVRIAVAVVAGALVGVATAGMSAVVNYLHALSFDLPDGAHLSAYLSINPVRLALIPALGGLAFGALLWHLKKRNLTDIVDPVEANALYGGRLSLRDSTRLTGLTLASNACGASVGMEAAYSQFGAGIFSTLGSAMKLRREDQRSMLTAGAAAAIAAAFNAPLAGAFYGFELVHSSYSYRTFTPVLAACLSSVFVVKYLGYEAPVFVLNGAVETVASYGIFAILGIVAALVGITAMRSATTIEGWLTAAGVPGWSRPAIGGIALSVLAFGCPQILGAGHGAMQLQLDKTPATAPLVVILVCKIIAAALSLGAGFKGGLFSSSLFIGVLLGAVFSQVLVLAVPSLADQKTVLMLAGMAATGAAIVGTPLTMVFLVLETSDNLDIAFATVLSVLVASTFVRLTFGYSFSTWRFHLRGLPLHGAQDIGWVSALTAARLMRSDFTSVPLEMSLRSLRQRVPLGSRKWIFGMTKDGRYGGIIDVAAVHDPEHTEIEQVVIAADMTTAENCYVLPHESISAILKKFEACESEILAVVQSQDCRKIIGSVSEAFCLKRYSQELEQRRSYDLGMK